jgi:hypothetical protein
MADKKIVIVDKFGDIGQAEHGVHPYLLFTTKVDKERESKDTCAVYLKGTRNRIGTIIEKRDANGELESETFKPEKNVEVREPDKEMAA